MQSTTALRSTSFAICRNIVVCTPTAKIPPKKEKRHPEWDTVRCVKSGRCLHPGIRLWRRYPHPSSDEQARRPSGGVCEPDFLTLRVEKLGSNRGDTAKERKTASRMGYRAKHPGIRQSRRYPHPSPDEQARRSSGGVCEPDFLTLRVERPASNRGDTAKERKTASRMGYRFLWR